MCWKAFKAEFRKTNFLLDYGQPSDFAQLVCRCDSILFVGYRVLVPFYLWGIFIYSCIEFGAGLLVTFTYWSFIVLSVTSTIQAGTAVYHYVTARRRKELPQRMPIVYRIEWVGSNIVMVAAPALVIIYWTILYEGEVVTVSNATVHGANAIYVLLDRCFTASPVRLLHAWHCMLYGVVYAIFTALHFAAGGEPIYPPLDYYDAPGLAVGFLAGLIFIIAPIFHLLMYLLTLAREVIRGKCGCACRGNSLEASLEESKGQELDMQPAGKYTSSTVELGVENPALQIDENTIN